MSSDEKKADIQRYHQEMQKKAQMDSGAVTDTAAVIIPGENTKAKQILSNLEAGEPYFVFRAKDILSLFALEAYAELIKKFGSFEQYDSVMEAQAAFLEWQRANPGKVKLPD